MFGDDYPTPYGRAIRDYIHVSDLTLIVDILAGVRLQLKIS